VISRREAGWVTAEIRLEQISDMSDFLSGLNLQSPARR
jgi:hypothetical protein